MKFQNTFALVAAVVAIAIAPSAHAVNLVSDGDFSVPPGGSTFTTYSAGQSFGPWNVTSGSVDLIGGYWQAPSVGGGSVDMDGTVPGSMNQTINMNPGNYVLTFSLSGNPQGGNPLKTLQTSIDGVTNLFTYNTAVSGNTTGSMNYAAESMAFTVSGIGPQTLTFTSLDDGSSAFGPVVGNVSILSAVPLPASALLFGSALMGLATFAFYRRRQAL